MSGAIRGAPAGFFGRGSLPLGGSGGEEAGHAGRTRGGKTRRARPTAPVPPPPPKPTPTPDAPARQPPQIETRRRETALVSFRDRNRNVPNPPPAEIHIDCGSVFAHGGHFALNQRK